MKIEFDVEEVERTLNEIINKSGPIQSRTASGLEWEDRVAKAREAADQKVDLLKKEYDRCLGNADKKGMDKCFSEIKAVRDSCVKLADPADLIDDMGNIAAESAELDKKADAIFGKIEALNGAFLRLGHLYSLAVEHNNNRRGQVEYMKRQVERIKQERATVKTPTKG